MIGSGATPPIQNLRNGTFIINFSYHHPYDYRHREQRVNFYVVKTILSLFK
jgi:hypothetical protein